VVGRLNAECRQVDSRRGLFAVTSARIVLTADIDVLDDLAVALVSVVVETETRALSVWLADELLFLEAGDRVALRRGLRPSLRQQHRTSA
jgi:hypothetical protein